MKKLLSIQFVLITVLSGLMTVCLQMTVSAMPLFVVDIGVAKSLAGTATTACTLASLLFRGFAAKITDRAGGRAAAIAGSGLYVLVFFTYQFCGNIIFLLVLRILQGIGMSLITTALGTVATAMVPKDQITRGMSYFSLGNATALSIGPAIGLWLVQSFNFSILFLFGMSASLLSVALLLVLKTDKAASGRVPHSKGSQEKKIQGNFWKKAVECGALFPATLMALMILCQTSLSTYLSFFTESLSVGGASTFFTLNVVGMIASKFLIGRANELFGEKRVAIASGILLAGSYLLISMTSVLGEGGVLTAGVLYGFGYGSFYTVLNVATVRNTNEETRSVANSAFFGSKDIGTAVGSLAWGAMTFLGYEAMYGVATGIIVLITCLYFVQLKKECAKK